MERHRLGPRVYFLGIRWHEWHLGVLVLAALGAAWAAGEPVTSLPSAAGLVVAAWLVLKDWRDLTPKRRDTGAWRLGLHRPPLPLRSVSRAEPLPLVVSVCVAAFALVNLLSALTPDIGWRGHLLLQIEAVEDLRVFHALAVPASVALLVCAYYLYRRRRRALQLAVALLVVLAVLNVFKGLDFEEAAGDLVVAGALFAGRGAFRVRHDPLGRGAAAVRAPLAVAAGFAISFVLVAAVARASPVVDLRETWDLLLWQPGPLVFHDETKRMDLAVGLLGVGTLLVAAYLLFRPLAAPRSLPDAEVRAAAADLVRRHGRDTLAYFKLRRDKHYLFGDDRRAFLGYRVESGVLCVSGDPVGPRDAIPALLRELAAFAEARDLRLAALGVSEEIRPLFEQLGLRAIYMGDEAVVDTSSFTLEGRAIRKVRQSVTRLEKAGFEAELVDTAAVTRGVLDDLERVARLGRQGAPERGFSMALDAVRPGDQPDTVLLLARDPEGRLRGFLHFVPSYGRAAMSLSLMRRDPGTPNGLTEFMIVKAIEALRGRGIEEVSLNFAAFARYLYAPSGRLERVAAALARKADAVFQIERLYRFNAKFFPRWEPRYAMAEGVAGLPRAALAALWLEGQLPKPRLRLGSRSRQARTQR